MASLATANPSSTATNKTKKQHKHINRPNPIQIFLGPTAVPAPENNTSINRWEHQLPRPTHHSQCYPHRRAQHYLYTPPPPFDIPSIEYLSTGAIILHRILPNNPPSTPTQLLFHIQNRTRDRTAKSIVTDKHDTSAQPSSLVAKLTSLRLCSCHSTSVKTTSQVTLSNRPVIGYPTDFRVM